MSNVVEIQLISAANAHVLDCVDSDVFDDPVQPEYLQAFLANPANVLAVAITEHQVIGMASGITYVHPDKPLALFINEVGVAGPYQQRGIGKQLVQALLAHGESIGCTTAWVATEVSNLAARALYRSLGGEEDSEHAVVYNFASAKPSPKV